MSFGFFQHLWHSTLCHSPRIFSPFILWWQGICAWHECIWCHTQTLKLCNPNTICAIIVNVFMERLLVFFSSLPLSYIPCFGLFLSFSLFVFRQCPLKMAKNCQVSRSQSPLCLLKRPHYEPNKYGFTCTNLFMTNVFLYLLQCFLRSFVRFVPHIFLLLEVRMWFSAFQRKIFVVLSFFLFFFLLSWIYHQFECIVCVSAQCTQSNKGERANKKDDDYDDDEEEDMRIISFLSCVYFWLFKSLILQRYGENDRHYEDIKGEKGLYDFFVEKKPLQRKIQITLLRCCTVFLFFFSAHIQKKFLFDALLSQC